MDPMEPKLQHRIQRYGWDKATDHYEPYWARQLEPARGRLLAMANLQAGERVLDVACGTGSVTFPAAKAVGSRGQVFGTDLSQRMIDTAREEAGKRGLVQTTFDRRGAKDLGFPESSFDAALCALGLMYIPGPLVAAKEMLRVLKPGGRAVAAVWGARDRCGWAEIFPIVNSRVRTEVHPMFFQLGTADGLRLTFEAAGFTDLESDRISTRITYDSAEEALGAAFVGGPVALAYSRFDDQTREEAHAEYLASIETYRKGDGYEIPGEFVVARGVKPLSRL
jgi:ubiquinone/menaquinone biosynthesis C-methylase UbiE